MCMTSMCCMIRFSYNNSVDQVDDTVGNLAGGRYYNKESVAAVTLGMGTDATYVEPADAALQWHGPSPKLGEMVSDYDTCI